jgi:hypothetical protein
VAVRAASIISLALNKVRIVLRLWNNRAWRALARWAGRRQAPLVLMRPVLLPLGASRGAGVTHDLRFVAFQPGIDARQALPGRRHALVARLVGRPVRLRCHRFAIARVFPQALRTCHAYSTIEAAGLFLRRLPRQNHPARG